MERDQFEAIIGLLLWLGRSPTVVFPKFLHSYGKCPDIILLLHFSSDWSNWRDTRCKWFSAGNYKCKRRGYLGLICLWPKPIAPTTRKKTNIYHSTADITSDATVWDHSYNSIYYYNLLYCYFKETNSPRFYPASPFYAILFIKFQYWITPASLLSMCSALSSDGRQQVLDDTIFGPIFHNSRVVSVITIKS